MPCARMSSGSTSPSRGERVRPGPAAVERYPDLAARVVLISTRREEDFADLIAASPAAGFVWKARLSAGAVRDLVTAADE
jgi:hypothetical protein